MVSIYALRDPETGQVHYVGQTVRSADRLADHLTRGSLRANTAKNLWLRGLLARGLTPEFVVLEVGPIEDGQALERQWIDHFIGQGAPLLNITHCSTANGDPQRRRQGRPPGKDYPIHRTMLLTEADQQTLKQIASGWECSESEAVRRLVRAKARKLRIKGVTRCAG